jgi:HTH-type transcriptional regulator, sugar sensing transcriptional regulator
MIEQLKKSGLSETEAKVYLALLDLGPSLAGKISRRTGLHRRTVYDTTERLIKKGLIGYILENNRRLFRASNPEKIVEMIDERKNLVMPIMNSLALKYNETKKKEETNFYKGKEGLKTVFEDQLNYKEVLILGASPKAYEVLQFYFKWYDKKRKLKKIKTRIIAQDRRIKRIPLAEIRYLPEKYENPVSMNIYGDNVAIILWGSAKPMAIVIKNEEMAKGYRQYFELVWNIAKQRL